MQEELLEEIIEFVRIGDSQLPQDVQVPSLQTLSGLELEEFIFELNKQLRERYDIMQQLLEQNNIDFSVPFRPVFDEEELLDVVLRYNQDASVVKSLLGG